MLMEPFDVLGFWQDDIYFFFKEKVVVIHKRLPKEDMILKLKVEPEDVKALRDEILVQASQKQLSWDEKEQLERGKI